MYIEVHRHWAAKYITYNVAKNTTLSWIQAPCLTITLTNGS